LILRGTGTWNKQCELLHSEIAAFLEAWDREQPKTDRQLRLYVENGG